ncbi:hypothetical protein BY996DRAFT_2439228 [Phakopsora pachyrhizi]|nr:hypothetical protein BY996DRAFT_2439228 [Phakopsora pachyrhizi]
MGEKLPSLVAKRAVYIENWGMARLWSYSICYCLFLIDLWLNPICYFCFMPIFFLWLNPICYVCFMPICGFIQFVMSALCLFVVLSNLLCLLYAYLWFYAPSIDISC